MKAQRTKSLILEDDEDIEKRVAKILEFLTNYLSPNGQWVVKGVEATGDFGGELIEKINIEKTLTLTHQQVLQLFKEYGQVIEFDGFVSNDTQTWLRLIVYDGCDVDILYQCFDIPDGIIGSYIEETVGEHFGI